MVSPKFDIVVYGATGFTGQLVAEYLASHYKNDGNLKWAMAGRSKQKLASVRDTIGAPADTPLIVADASDAASLQAMIGQTKSVITTVGPYLLCGNKLVAACAASGTDYFDLCGETSWMRRMIDKHEAAAKASGARILFSCGYDFIPFELGVFFCEETARKNSRCDCQPRQGSGPRDEGHAVGRHSGKHEGDFFGGKRPTTGGAVAKPVRVDAGL